MYLRMFVDDYKAENEREMKRDISDTLNNRDNGTINAGGGSSNDDYSSLNERVESSSEPSLNEVDF